MSVFHVGSWAVISLWETRVWTVSLGCVCEVSLWTASVNCVFEKCTTGHGPRPSYVCQFRFVWKPLYHKPSLSCFPSDVTYNILNHVSWVHWLPFLLGWSYMNISLERRRNTTTASNIFTFFPLVLWCLEKNLMKKIALLYTLQGLLGHTRWNLQQESVKRTNV